MKPIQKHKIAFEEENAELVEEALCEIDVSTHGNEYLTILFGLN